MHQSLHLGILKENSRAENKSKQILPSRKILPRRVKELQVMEREIIPQHLIPDPKATVKSEASLRLFSEEFWLRVLGASGVVSCFYPFPLLVHVS